MYGLNSNVKFVAGHSLTVFTCRYSTFKCYRYLCSMDPYYRIMQGVRVARKVEKHCHNVHSWNVVVCNSRSNQRMNLSFTPYNSDAFLINCTWRPLLPDHIPACQMTRPSQTINVISRHVRGFWHRLWNKFKWRVVQRVSAPRLWMCQRSLPTAESLQSAAQANRRAQRTLHNVGFVTKCDSQAVRVFVYIQHAQLTVVWSHYSRTLIHKHSQLSLSTVSSGVPRGVKHSPNRNAEVLTKSNRTANWEENV